MSELEARKEALELLARGKISIDEAVALIEQPQRQDISKESADPIYKAEIPGNLDNELVNGIKIDDPLESNDDFPANKHKLKIEEIEPSEAKPTGKQPSWLRIRVGQLESGKNRVSVNIPFGMVKFGLGIARVFSPEIEGVDFNGINDVISKAETGLLVDVQDEESNEHVQIYLE